jgi:hypothetical protein
MLDAVKVLLESISALQAASLANRFMIPYAMAGRVPTDDEIECGLINFESARADKSHLKLFVGLCHEMRDDAKLLAHCPGRG